MSNLAGWLKVAGADHVPAWLAASQADNVASLLAGAAIVFWAVKSPDAARIAKTLRAAFGGVARMGRGDSIALESGDGRVSSERTKAPPPNAEHVIIRQPIVLPPPRPLPASEVEKRIQILDQIYTILNTVGEDALNDGSRLANNYHQYIRDLGPDGFVARLHEWWRDQLQGTSQKIAAIRQEHPLQESLFSSVLKGSAHHAGMGEAWNAFQADVSLLGPQPHDPSIKLIRHSAERFKASLAPYGKYLNDSKQEIKSQRAKLL